MNVRFALMLVAVFVGLLIVVVSPQAATAADTASDGIFAQTADLVPMLAQDSEGGSSVRITGRSIRGLISLGVLVVGGIGWVVKKIVGGEINGSAVTPAQRCALLSDVPGPAICPEPRR